MACSCGGSDTKKVSGPFMGAGAKSPKKVTVKKTATKKATRVTFGKK